MEGAAAAGPCSSSLAGVWCDAWLVPAAAQGFSAFLCKLHYSLCSRQHM